MRKIIAVTGARSEYDILYPILNELQQRNDIEVNVLVTGAHLSERYGKTVKLIEKDGFKICDRVYNLIDTDEKIGRILSLGNQINSFAHIFTREQPDIVLVVGDREESISTSMTCAYLNICCAHIAGGDIAKDGNIDNSVRYATSKFAHLHFVILNQHKKNLLKLGEDEWRIFVHGNPALDRFVNTEHLSKVELSNNLGTTINDKYLVLIQHPTITTIDNEAKYIKQTLDAVVDSGLQCFINYPNSDAGNFPIIEAYDEYTSKYPQLFLFKNLDRISYINLLRHATCLIGNSSSGIIEAPSLGLPVVNIGIRQKGRFSAGNVIFVENEKSQISSAIDKSVNDLEYREKIDYIENPYGNGQSGKSIADTLSKVAIDDNVLFKNITY